MVKIVEAEPRSGKGRLGELAGLARLRRECRRFREEVVCIRSFPRLQLRWPSLARLEIGNESSEEDDAVWDTAEDQTCDSSFTSRQTVGIGQNGVRDCVELESQILAPETVENKSLDHATLLREGSDETWRRSSKDVEASIESIEAPGISEGRGVFATVEVCQKPRIGGSVLHHEGTSDKSVESQKPSQILDSISAAKEATQSSHDANFVESASGQHSPKDPTLSNVHTNAGARRAATALFTANPHYNCYKISTECSPPSSFRCQSEGFELIGFPGSYVSDNANHNEMESWSQPVVCSSFESLTCSSSEHSGHATTNKRNQTYAHVHTDLPTHTGKPSLSCVSGATPNCRADVGHACGKAQIEREFKGAPVSSQYVQSSHVGAGACQSCILDNVNLDKYLHVMPNSDMIKGNPPSSAESFVRSEVSFHSMPSQHQNSACKEGHQEQQLVLTKDFAERQFETCLSSSGFKEASTPPRRTVRDDSHTVFASGRESLIGPAENYVSCSGLIALSGMENFAMLGVGSTRDSAMAALMSIRIKLALENLGKDRGREHVRGKYRSKGRIKDSRRPTVSWKDPLQVDGVPSKRTSDRAELETLTNPVDLCRNSDTGRLESHFFSKRDHCTNSRLKKCSSKSSFEAQPPAAEEPDLYLQQVISALDCGHELEDEVPSPASPAGSGKNADPPDFRQAGFGCTQPSPEAHMTRDLRGPHAEEVCKSHANANGVLDYGLPRCLDIAKPKGPIEEIKSGKDGSGFDDSNVTRHSNYQEDQHAFSVQINVPPGSSVAVESGSPEDMRAKRQAGSNRCLDFSPNAYHPGSNVPVLNAISTSPQRRSPPSPPRTCSQTQSSHNVLVPSSSSPSRGPSVDQEERIERSPTGTTKPALHLGSQGDLPPTGRLPKTLRFNTEEDQHRFDRKIASLVKKATQLEEETMLPSNFPRKAKASRQQERSLEERMKRPSVSKVTQTKSSEFSPHVRSNRSQSLATQTGEELQAFGSAAAEVVSELNMMMKNQRSELNLDSGSRSKRKVVWASPVAEELKTRPVTMKPHTKLVRGIATNTSQPVQPSTACSNAPTVDKAASPEVQAFHNAGKPKAREKMPPPKQCTSVKHNEFHERIPQLESVAIPPAIARARLERNGVSQAANRTLGYSRTVGEQGLTKTRKVLNGLTGGVFNCHEFRQELKELQEERKKLESLVNTILSTDTGPLNSGIGQGTQNAKDVSGGVQKTSTLPGIPVERNPSMGGSTKRQKSASSPQDGSGGRLTGLDRGGLDISGKRSSRQPLPLSSKAGNDGLSDECLRISSTAPRHEEGKGAYEADECGQKPSCADRQENLKMESIFHHVQEQTTQTSPQNPQDVQCKADNGQKFMNVNSFSPGPRILQRTVNSGNDLQIITLYDTHVETHATESLKQNAPREPLVCPSGGICVAAATGGDSGGVAKNLNLHARSVGFQEHASQPLDSSICLLQPRGSQPTIRDPSGLKMPGVTDNVARATENLTGTESEVKPCDVEFFGKTTVNNKNSVLVKTEVPQGHELGYLVPVDMQKSSSCQQSLEQAGHQQIEEAPAPQHLKTRSASLEHEMTGKEDLKGRKSEFQRTTPEAGRTSSDRSEEHQIHGAASDTETSWTGSLQSVLAAYEAAQMSAARALTSVVDVRILKARQPVASGREHNGTVPSLDKKKLKLHRIHKTEEKLLPLALLEEAEKKEAKELRLRLARKEHRSQQKFVMNRGQLDRKEKRQSGLRNENRKLQQLKVPKFIYRTGEFGLKGREEWNDSTVASQDVQTAGRKATAKDATESVIKKVLRDELKRKHRQKHTLKTLQPMKAIEVGNRRKKSDHIDLEIYGSTLALTKAKERPTMAKKTMSGIDCKGERSAKQHFAGEFGQNLDTTIVGPTSKSRNHDLCGQVCEDEHKITNHAIDELSTAFGRERPFPGLGADLVNEDVRNSVEHWLNTSGGFEYLEAFDDTGEANLFDRQESNRLLPREIDFANVVPVRDGHKELHQSGPGSQADTGRVRPDETVVPRRLTEGLSADQAEICAVRRALQYPPCKPPGRPHEVGSSDKQAEGLAVNERDSQQTRKTFECIVLEGSDKQSGGVTAHGASDLQNEEVMLGNAGDTVSHALDGILAGGDEVATLAEDEELQVALLEIMLQTILKDDSAPEIYEKMTRGTSPEPKAEWADDHSCPVVTNPSTPASKEQEPPLQTSDDKASLEQIVPRLACNVAATESASDLQASGSAKSSGGEWPEYKCLADMRSTSGSSDGKGWPKGKPEDEQVARVGNDLGEGIDEEAPSEQISTPTSEPETDQKRPVDSVPIRTGQGGTRPPYSAIHSVRAAERQHIDFPGIASLAFGYPSPRPPQPKPAGQTNIDTSSVSVQTADLSSPPPPQNSPSVYVVPYYGLMDSLMPSYSMYASPYPAPEGPSQANVLPLASHGPHGLQFVPPHFGLTPRGVVPMFYPPFMFAPPVAPTVQNSPQAPAPCTNVEHAPKATTELRRVREGASQPAAMRTKSRPSNGNRGSCSSLDSRCSSPTTPSTCPSSPEHEARVASALLERASQRVGGLLFPEGSSDEAEPYRENLGCPSRQDQGTQIEDDEKLLPQSLSRATDVEDIPAKPIVTHNSRCNSRVEIGPDLRSLHMPAATSSTAGTKTESGTSISVDSGRSTVLIASYDGSGSSESSLMHVPGMPRGRSAYPQTSLWASGGIVGTAGILFRRPDGNQAHCRSHAFLRTLPLSEGEYEPGQLPSEGECANLFHNFWATHRSSQFVRPLNGQDDVSEPGEIGQHAIARLVPPSMNHGGQISNNQSLSEGEVKAGYLTEPGEVKP